MRQSPSTSSRSRAALLLALIASPHDGSSFSPSRTPTVAIRPKRSPLEPFTASHRRRPLPLQLSVDSLTRPVEEEREKNSGQTSQEDQKEWKQVVGGFVPKFLKRDADAKYPSIEMVDTIADYKRVVVDEEDRIVVVRFFAPWCKSCKAAQPMFKKMVSQHSPSVKFVEVPLTKGTAYIHEGLGVPSVPFGHIYHPHAGLVEEKKINRKVFKEFRDDLDSYVRGSCDILMEDDQDDESLVDKGFQ